MDHCSKSATMLLPSDKLVWRIWKAASHLHLKKTALPPMGLLSHEVFATPQRDSAGFATLFIWTRSTAVIAPFVQSLLCSYTVVYALFTLWKLDLKKQWVTHAAVWLQNESSSALDQLQTPKGLGNSGSDWHIWAQILHQFPIKFFIWKKSSQKYIWFVHPLFPCQQLPILPWNCQNGLPAGSVRTEQPCTNGATTAVPHNSVSTQLCNVYTVWW